VSISIYLPFFSGVLCFSLHVDTHVAYFTSTSFLDKIGGACPYWKYIKQLQKNSLSQEEENEIYKKLSSQRLMLGK
jgi:hypothetical protein